MSTFGDFEIPPPPPSFADDPAPDSFPPGPPSPPPLHTGGAPQPRRRSVIRPALVGALMVVCAAAGAGAATLLGARATSSPTAPNNGAQNPFGLAPGAGQNPFGNAGSGGSGANSGSGSGSVNASAIAAQVDPAVVDLNGYLPNNAGEQQGTGMVISSSGLVLTNNHVIEGTTSLTAQIDGAGTVYQAKVVGDDPTADVALVQIEGVSGLRTVTLGDSSSVTQGEAVVAIGNALGRGTLVTVTGTVTGLNQTITASDDTGYGAETLTGLVETDAPIQPGDSGGPVVDSHGRVIAMDTAAETSGRPFSGTGTPASAAYAIGINDAMAIVRQIEAGGGGNASIQLGGGALLGVEIATTGNTASVIGVTPGGPAASAGIGAGDVITELGGAWITTPDSLHQAMLHHRPGDVVSVTWTDSSGASHTATVTLASGPPA